MQTERLGEVKYQERENGEWMAFTACAVALPDGTRWDAVSGLSVPGMTGATPMLEPGDVTERIRRAALAIRGAAERYSMWAAADEILAALPPPADETVAAPKAKEPIEVSGDTGEAEPDEPDEPEAKAKRRHR